MSIDSRLKKAEQTAHARTIGTDNRPCTCPHGKQRAFFIVKGATDAEILAQIPYNREYCPRCGGARYKVYIDKTDLGA